MSNIGLPHFLGAGPACLQECPAQGCLLVPPLCSQPLTFTHLGPMERSFSPSPFSPVLPFCSKEDVWGHQGSNGVQIIIIWPVPGTRGGGSEQGKHRAAFLDARPARGAVGVQQAAGGGQAGAGRERAGPGGSSAFCGVSLGGSMGGSSRAGGACYLGVRSSGCREKSCVKPLTLN